MASDGDLVLEAFTILREHFFDQNGTPKAFPLREKRNTQDNPLDEYICGVLRNHLHDSECVPAPGPLINPDLVLLRPEKCNCVSKAALLRRGGFGWINRLIQSVCSGRVRI